jgi:FkbM family methyltransferase
MSFNYFFDRYFIKQPRLRRFVTSLFESDRDLDVEVAGATLRINSRREHGYLRASRLIKRNGTLRDELPVLMNLFAIIRDGDTFVDIGANTGLFTHSMARLTGLYPRFKIYSIEAHPNTYSRLSSREGNRVTYMNLAMSDTAGELEFIDGAVSHVFTAIDKQNSYNIPGETITVHSRRLDDLEFDSDSIVLKIDVEGQELRVLEGASGILTNGSVRAVYLDGYDDASINDLLIGYGFKLYDGRTLRPVVGKTFSLLALRECRTAR